VGPIESAHPDMTKLLVDTDTAGDDVTSLLFALMWPDVELVGITVCAGNVLLDQCVENACYTIDVCERHDVPVYAGADRPLERELVTAHHVHGDDGMGNSNFPSADKSPEREHAANATATLADRHSGELEVIAQAPLTNLALALRLDPHLPTKIKRLWVMGGTNNSLGNVTPAAEFNFFVDPEAAHAVLSAGFELTLVPWDVCVKDGYLMRDGLEEVGALRSRLSEFYLSTQRAVWEFNRAHPHGFGIDGVSHPDALVAAMFIDRNVIDSSNRYYVDVETHGELTRGYSLVDVLGVLDMPPNAEVVERADGPLFRKMLLELLASR
jgi:purine nucleosidase